MNNEFYSYLDGFDTITLIIPKSIHDINAKYYLLGNGEEIDLIIKERYDLGNEEKVVVSFDAYLKLELSYSVKDTNGNKSLLRMGKIHRASLFDSIYYYKKNDLGAIYTKETTKFKIWAPTAQYVGVELISPNGEKSVYGAKYRAQGIWRTIIDKDLEGYKYRYIITLNGKTKKTVDPYAISASANGKYAYIVDKDKFYKMKYPVKHTRMDNNIIIYETSIRDFTSLFKDDEKTSTYELFTSLDLKTKKDTPAGLKYLKSLGVTHIQIMPMFLFGGIDELKPKAKYNWGYNPVLYNVPSGAYTLNPEDPYERINKLKEMIDILHKNGFKVVMDVVYNHVYNYDTFPFEIMCPGYMYRYKDGMLTAYSGCKNDINSRKNMVRKYIIDSVKYWHSEYELDGFRFDLMGLIDFETINDITLDLKETNPNILVYGEGWKMIASNESDNLAHMYNKSVISDVGFFNDKFREAIKHYSMNKYTNIFDVIEVIKGSCKKGFLFKYPHQSINYCECHDNLTIYDYMKVNLPNEKEEIIKKRTLLALSMTLLSIGIPFMHVGMEFNDTKKMIDNTYNKPDSINKVDWNLIDDNKTSIAFTKKLIDIRKKHDVFKIDKLTDITERIDVNYNRLNTIIYKLKDDNYELLIIFKTDERKEEFNSLDYDILASNIEYKDNELLGIGTMVLRRNL